MPDYEVKNLGQVKALHIGENAPTNLYLVWFDTANEVHKAYDFGLNMWVSFKSFTTITGLEPQQVLFGSDDGHIEQNVGFYYDKTINTLYLSPSIGGMVVGDGGDLSSTQGASSFSCQDAATGNSSTFSNDGWQLANNTNILYAAPDYIAWRTTSPMYETKIYRTTGGSTTYSLYLPNTQGAANTFLKNDGSGNLTWGLATGATISGLTPTLPLFGKADGTIEQDPLWFYNSATQYMRLGDPSGTIPNGGEYAVTSGTYAAGISASAGTCGFGCSGPFGAMSINGTTLYFSNAASDEFSIGRAAYTTDMYLWFPVAKGALNQSMYVSNVSGADVTLSWTTYAPLASPTFTGTVTIPSAFTLGATSVTTTGTQLNYLNAATGTTGTTTSNLVFSTSPSFTTSILPISSDGAAIGSTTLMWSDLFLASGAVINFDNGDVTMTHSANTLSFAGASSGYNFDAVIGGTSMTLTDKITTYNNIVTANNGVGSSVGTPIALTGQNAAIASSLLYTADSTGYYLICWNAVVTTAATSSSTLGHFQVNYTSPIDSVSKTTPTSNNVTAAATNTTGTCIGGTFTIYAKTGTNINYTMAYASSGATAMVYGINVSVFKL